MIVAMTRPTRRGVSGTLHVRKVVPSALRGIVGKRELQASLRTADADTARRLHAAKLAEFETIIANARAQLAGLTVAVPPREVAAMVGEWYRLEAARLEAEPGDPGKRDAELDVITDDRSDFTGSGEVVATPEDAATATSILRADGRVPDAASLALAARYVATARIELAQLALRRAGGDWGPDTVLASYPAVGRRAAASLHEPLAAGDLLKSWSLENPRAAATIRKYAAAFACVARVTGITDVRSLTPEAVASFKRSRLAEGRDPGTVADEVIACGGVCRWAVQNRLLATNPFERMAPKVTRRGPPARAPYDDAEAALILTAARAETGWKRWIPWLLAFTGARLNEVTDLRRGDVKEQDGVWIADIVPTAERAGKNETAQRMIPLHPAVIAEGFLEYVAALPPDPSGPLFPDLRAAPKGGRAGAASTDLGRWVRGTVGINDRRKAPAHSWRHRMEDELRRVRALPEVVDAITGRHNPRNAGAGYGVGFRRMPDNVLKDLQRVPSPVSSPSPAAAFASVPAVASAGPSPGTS